MHRALNNVSWRGKFAALLALLTVALVVAGIGIHVGASSKSAEPYFTDASKSGLTVVPASCPSDPHAPAVCDLPSDNPCTLTPSSASANAGDAVTLSWNITQPDWDTTPPLVGSGSPTENFNGNISPGAGVVTGMSGSVTVHPAVTTTYVLSGTVSAALPWAGTELGGARCQTTVSVGASCVDNPICTAGNVVNSCTGAVEQVCPAGCLSSKCLCPSGQFFYGGSCVSACPSGLYQYNDTCVASCPIGFRAQGNVCVFDACPSGYTFQNNACVQTSCSQGFYCSGSNLYNRDASCTSSLVSACTYGCSNGACNVPASPGIALWQVRPILVPSGNTVSVNWDVENVLQCTVTGSNGDTWQGSTGAQTSAPITGQTIYTLNCDALPGATPATVSESTTVNIVPQFHEQ